MPCTVAYFEPQRMDACGNIKGGLTPSKPKPFGSLLPHRSQASLAIGGHRGMGENLISEDHEARQRTSYWRENTIKSFLKAVEHGATFVEFDVQVTKDGVPVVWHDEYIAFGSAEAPSLRKIRHLTFQEFQAIGHRRAFDQLHELSPVYRHYKCKTTGLSVPKYWKCSDEDELPSLEQVFEKVPPNVGLNIEVKTQGLSESDQDTSEEVEFVTSAILSIVEKYSTSHLTRSVVFSSFDPLVVKGLKQKRSSMTAMFLSTGLKPNNELPKDSTFLSDIDWAHTNGLDGVVLDSTVLRMNQEVVNKALELGLIVMSYGTENNDHNWVLSQFNLGVHGAIVDDVEQVVANIVNHLF